MASCDIVIVNWNSGAQLAKAVGSICRHHHNRVSSVIVVDNASTDASLAKVEAMSDVPFPLQIIRNTENRGFGAACNQGAALAGSDYLLFLNPDTTLYRETIASIVDFMDSPTHVEVGICGAQLVDENGHISRSCTRFPTLAMFLAETFGLNRLFRRLGHFMAEWDHGASRQVDHLIGAFFMVRRVVFEALNGFDEQFFVYLEDLDFSRRANSAGWKSFYLADAKVFHAGGGTSHQVKAHRLFYLLRSRLLYGFKHFAGWQAWILVGLTLAVEPLSRSFFSLFSGGIHSLRDTWRGYIMLYRDIPCILKKSGQS